MLGRYKWRLSVLIGLYFAYRSQGWKPAFGSGNKYGIMFICERSDETGSANAGTQGSCCSTPDGRWVWSVCGMYLAGESHTETCSNATLCPAYSPWPAKDIPGFRWWNSELTNNPSYTTSITILVILLSCWVLYLTVDKKGKQVLTWSLAMIMARWQVKPRTICPKVWKTSEPVYTLHSREMLCLL